MKLQKIISEQDGLSLELAIIEPKQSPIGIIQFSHGMAEHKERYFEFMEFLANQGYICVIHDHRGHGASVKNEGDLGYFYTENSNYIVEDLYQITKYIKNKYPNLDIYLFSHSMGTLVARNYLKKYDKMIKKVVLCGPPTKNFLAPIGVSIGKTFSLVLGDKYRSKLLDYMTFHKYYHKNDTKTAWINSNENSLLKYEQDPLCGYVFTNNGMIQLYKLMENSFDKKNWQVNNHDLKIYVIAGSDDPVIQSEKKFMSLIKFLRGLGYKVNYKIYPQKRHELLGETENEKIYQDILNFYKEGEK